MPGADLADRIGALATLHPWMDASTSAVIANQQLSTQQMLGVAEKLRQQTANSYTGYTPYGYDPAQHQPSSVRAFAQGYVNTVAGGNPFTDSTLATMQRNLQRQGFGTNLGVTGAWSNDWQQALTQHAQAVFQDHLAGNKPGSVSSHGLLHNVLQSISPSGIVSSVWGSIRSLPSDFRQFVGDSVSGRFDPTTRLYGKHTSSGINAGVQQMLGGNATPESIEQGSALAAFVNDVGTMAFLVPGTGEAVGSGIKGLRALAKSADLAQAQAGQGVIRSSLGRTVGHEAAQRTPGMTAKIAVSRAGKRVVAGAAIGATSGGINAAAQSQDISTGITSGALTGAALGGAARFAERVGARTNVLPANALDNLPVLKQTGALIDRLSDDQGIYYRMRNRLAKPYEYGAVRLAGDTLTKAQALSLKVHGLAWLENTVGDDPNTQAIARYVAGSHPLDPIDHALAIAADKAHLPFTPKVDWLMYVLHGNLDSIGKEPAESQGLTGNLARRAQTVHDGVDAALGQTGYAERIIRATGRSYDQLLSDAHDSEEHLQDWMWDKVHQAAASIYADRVFSKLPVDAQRGLLADHDSYLTFLRTARDEAISNPETMADAHALLSQAPNSNYLETFIRKELISSKTQPGESLRHDIGDYVRAGNRLRDEILPRIATDFLTPQEVQFGVRGAAPEMQSTLIQHGFGWSGRRAAKGSVADGSIGLMRTGKLTSQKADADLREFGSRFNQLAAQRDANLARKANGPVDANVLARANEGLDTLYHELLDYAYHEHGISRRPLAVYKGADPAQGIPKLLNLLGDARKHLASEVYLADDAAPESRAAYQAIRDAGYTLVHGKDIGHLYLNRITRPGSLGQVQRRERQVAAALGANTERFSRTDVGTLMRLRMVSRLDKAQSSGRITLGQHGTARDVLNDLADPNQLDGIDNTWAQKIAFSLGAPFHRRNIKSLQELYGENPQQAEARLKTDLALAGGVRALSRKTAVRILTRLDNDGVPIMDEANAHRVYDEIMAAQSESATYMVGLTKIEDLMRFGAFKFAADHGWDLDKWRHVMALPNNLVRMRDNWRFAMNPMFSVRRIVKTNVKMVADGVEASHNPVRWLTDHQAADSAHTLLDRIEGTTRGTFEYKDEAERYLDSHDVWGIYDPRAYKAMYVWQKQQQGFAEQDIRKGLNRVFEYGGRGEQGRTALERTTNVFFFPFSFEKTLLRSVGGYLADHQAQALVLNQALDAYRQFSAAHPDSPLTKDWIAKHTPVLNEALRLNAFTHGISPGEFGGINAPVLNAFMPQSWATGKDSVQTLQRFVPAVADLHRIMGEINAQQSVVRTSLSNATAHLEGRGGNQLFRLPSNEVKGEQIGDALSFRLQLIDSFKQVVDYNDSQSDDSAKYHFGYADNIPDAVKGQVINRSTINQIVHSAYPAWNPDKAAEIAQQHQRAAQTWVNTQHGNPDAAQYQDYLDKAHSAIGHMSKDEYPVEQLTQVQSLFRDQAKALAKNNKGFRAVYDKNFARYFGPLDGSI